MSDDLSSSSSSVVALRQRAEQLLAKITPGEWEAYDNYVKIGDADMVQFDTGNPMVGDSSNDTHFIAAAPQLVRDLLAQFSAGAGQIAPGWQPIATAPKDGTHVLVAEGAHVGECRCIDGDWWIPGNDPTDPWGRPWTPTHWAPLPAPPTPEAGS